ncbi:hypothetical protein M8J77_007321 [Diaphorina citri]|nr:hypothetical protein M8J77_007321 [Diaphorina citri]
MNNRTCAISADSYGSLQTSLCDKSDPETTFEILGQYSTPHQRSCSKSSLAYSEKYEIIHSESHVLPHCTTTTLHYNYNATLQLQRYTTTTTVN